MAGAQDRQQSEQLSEAPWRYSLCMDTGAVRKEQTVVGFPPQQHFWTTPKTVTGPILHVRSNGLLELSPRDCSSPFKQDFIHSFC